MWANLQRAAPDIIMCDQLLAPSGSKPSVQKTRHSKVRVVPARRLSQLSCGRRYDLWNPLYWHAFTSSDAQIPAGTPTRTLTRLMQARPDPAAWK